MNEKTRWEKTEKEESKKRWRVEESEGENRRKTGKQSKRE